MPLSKGGKYFSNPAVGRAQGESMDSDDAEPKDVPEDGEEAESESPAVGHHILKNEKGGFTSVSHHEDGSVVNKEHDDLDGALERSREIFDDGGMDSEEDQGAEESLGQASKSDDGGY